MVGYPSTEPPRVVRDALQEGSLAGVILFKRNLVDGPEAVAETLATLKSPEPALVAVDQEGGRVARFGPPVLKLPPMRVLGERDDLELTRRCGRVLGRQLKALGFTMDFAPVLDVDTNPDNPVIGDRSFGREPERVIRHGLAFADGLADAGLLGCGKHFPGHGDTDTDSHFALPTLRHDLKRLEAVELAPFAAASRIPALMTAHVLFEALDPEVPATLSKAVVTDLLRGRLGYPGVVISDDLEMKAVADRYGVSESAVRAIEAGCDLLLVCSDVDACFAAREALARRASEDAAFATRLREAGDRTLAMRAKVPSTPLSGDALRDALNDPEARALEEVLA
ncbi:MAG: beta-N-acetylhexosaminidase [Sandaracinus sp.]|nr:beta-N-acetylhexosaminidase [Sandaracinus sp.]MCB9630732.1 beta-N-acetylhexosaminidase [Sandaracinus sp.]